ncbi:MAG: fructokinase [SAR86 cluster bacterium]|uniref:Fructokinase n=1 Tax=SAR86 cluster bacterium TaxID=2030880 RepID=A0A2A4X4N3_9GAMM|nr:MAG: fructokinase [SAR86 cluster bacterium]
MRIGVDLGGTKIEGILLSPDGRVAEKIRVNTPAQKYLETVDELCEVINQLQQLSPSKKCSVGIGTPGALSPSNERGLELMKNCNSICLNGEPLKVDIEKRLGYTTRIENDANCFVLSEACYGAAMSSRTVFGVILGTGTGGGVVIDKQLHTGPNRIAGEWGHNCIPSSVRELIAQDRQCYCGRKNCIETVLSGRGLKQSHLERSGIELEAMEIARLATVGNVEASESIQTYCKQLARCLSTVVNLIDPDMIVLGGGLSNISQLYAQVPSLMEEHVFTDNMLTMLSAPMFGDASGAIGAACLWPLD